MKTARPPGRSPRTSTCRTTAGTSRSPRSNQKLVTRKHRKLRRLRELQPLIDITLLYQRDYLALLVKYGLEAPEHLGDEVQMAAEPLGLLGLGTLHLARRPD